MGVGHVPTGPIPEAGQGDELPRRQHRRARTFPASLADRTQLARFGESIAASFLARRGFEIVDRNRAVGRGEVDLVVKRNHRHVVVEVKTRQRGGVDPVEAFTYDKARQVRRLAAQLGIRRVDLVAVWVGGEFIDIRWLPQAA